MSTAVVHRGTLYDPQGNVIRRGTDPRLARAQAFYSMMSGSYTGARSDKRNLQDWSTSKASANADILATCPAPAARATWSATRFAAGVINTVCTNAIGTGLPRSVDTEYSRNGSA
jgi:hypothetical protein